MYRGKGIGITKHTRFLAKKQRREKVLQGDLAQQKEAQAALNAQWLRENGLATGAPGGAGLDLDLVGRDWATVTWGDSDIMTTLRNECKAKGLPFPAHFRKWINLKVRRES